jgi:threonine aldolase
VTRHVEPSDPARQAAVDKACTRRLSGSGRRTLQDVAAELADEASRGGEADRYGNGGVVPEVEEQVRELFGAEAAVLMPSGTMAQQAALRLHADERSLRRVAMHPTSHPLIHEEQALPELHGLEIVEETGDLTGVAAVLLEVPQRETGGDVPTWDELVEVSFRCAAEGVALHLDGARLWQCGPWFAPRTLAEVVGLADTTYVSLYKDLGGTAGAILLCPEELAAPARTWRHRHGGTLPALWPMALGARRGLRERLPRMPLYVEAAQALGAVLETTCEVRSAMMHAVLEGEPKRLADALVDVSERSGVWLAGYVLDGPRVGTGAIEISCGEATLALSADEVATLLAEASALATA